MKKIVKVVAFISISLPMLMAFQNCSRSGFSTSDKSVADSLNLNLSNDSNVITLKLKPGLLTNQLSSEFEVEIEKEKADIVKAIEYKIDDGDWATAWTIIVANALTPGNHKISLRAISKDGSKTPPLDYIWFVDSVKPELIFNSTPPLLAGLRDVVFEFSANDSLTTVEKVLCYLDDEEIAGCVSPIQLNALAKGPHRFHVKAMDKAGNLSEDLLYDFEIVDPTLKAVVLQAKPAAITNLTSAEISFITEGEGNQLTSFQCKLDDGSFAACMSPYSVADLPDGLHKFSIQGKDAEMNESAVTEYTWRIDTVKPSLALMAPFSSYLLSAEAPPTPVSTLLSEVPVLSSAHLIGFDVIDFEGSGIDRIECRVENYEGENLNLLSDFSACASPFDQSTNMSGGVYRFTIQAFDNAGNKEVIAAEYRMPEHHIPFMTINLDGGAALMANVLPLDIDKILLSSYSKLGGGTPLNIPIIMDMGAAWTGYMYEGISQILSPADIAKVKVFSIANRSASDTSTNMLLASGMIEKLGRRGSMLPFARNGNLNQQAAGFNPSAVYEVANLPELQGLMPSVDASSLDPRTNPAMATAWGISAQAYANDSLMGQAALTLAVVKGHIGSGFLNLGGYDYHNGYRNLGDAKDRAAGVMIGKVIKTALLENRRLLLNVTTDGTVRSLESSTASSGWVSDSSEGVQLFFVVDPMDMYAYENYMIGAFDTNQSVHETAVAYSTPAKAAAIVACNYAFFSQKSSCAAEVNNLLSLAEIETTKVILEKPK